MLESQPDTQPAEHIRIHDIGCQDHGITSFFSLEGQHSEQGMYASSRHKLHCKSLSTYTRQPPLRTCRQQQLHRCVGMFLQNLRQQSMGEAHHHHEHEQTLDQPMQVSGDQCKCRTEMDSNDTTRQPWRGLNKDKDG
jgi:hypothetical protein